jgi:hypothetical protein
MMTMRKKAATLHVCVIGVSYVCSQCHNLTQRSIRACVCCEIIIMCVSLFAYTRSATAIEVLGWPKINTTI